MTDYSVRAEDIEAEIVDEMFYVFPGTTVTVCALVLRNGFTVIGQSATVDSAAFDAAKGRAIARDDAANKIWSLLGFRLRDAMEFGTEVPEAD